MESMPPGAAAPCGSGSGISVTTTSDVKKVLATDAAFSKAHRTTLVGSMIPAFRRSSYTPGKAARIRQASVRTMLHLELHALCKTSFSKVAHMTDMLSIHLCICASPVCRDDVYVRCRAAYLWKHCNQHWDHWTPTLSVVQRCH